MELTVQSKIREELSIEYSQHSHLYARVPLVDPLSPDSALGQLLLKRVRAVRVRLDAAAADVFEARHVKPSEELDFPFNPRCLYLSLPPALVLQCGLLPGVAVRAKLHFELERSQWFDAALYAVESLRTPDLLFLSTLPSENTLLYKKLLEIMPKYADFGCDPTCFYISFLLK